ncbi:hypothetical protein RhiJN_09604 [Ceratobasidium sp. AG-Ba]|nr:hypothetical protein RhiJN_09604 [Ceratobasidium sp. AG-Ba]
MGRKSTMFARASRRAELVLRRLSADRGCVETYFGPPAYTCPYCSRTLKTIGGRERHIALQSSCRARRIRELKGYVSKHLVKKWQKERNRLNGTAAATDATPLSTQTPASHLDALLPAHTTPSEFVSVPVSLAKRRHTNFLDEDENLPLSKRQRIIHDNSLEEHGVPDQPAHPLNASGSRRKSRIIDAFPILTAGAPISDKKRRSKLSRKDLQDYLLLCGLMGDPDKFEVAELLMTTGLTGKNRTKYLKSYLAEGRRLWKNNYGLVQDVDRLPHGPKWIEQDITVGEGIYCQTHTLFRRDIVDVIRELLGDPRFKKCMRYAPEKHWTSHERACRLYGEMWSGNWWWRMQYLIGDPNGTVVPLIIASDKTTLSTMAGGQQAYPVYLTIGNISKGIQRKASKRATVILGYLPVDSFKDVTSKTLRSELRGQLLHSSMAAIMEPLKEASNAGVPMWCANGYLRRAYPTLAAFVGDWPEQNDMSCTVRSGCPICQQLYHGRGSGRVGQMRRHQDTVKAFRAYKATGSKAELKKHNLKPWNPFWIDLPNVDFPTCITPDILHQLHKGVFKNYVAEWTEEILGEAELDSRFMAMPKAKNLRHFKRGITSVSQWTGRETKEMVKQYLPIVAEDPKIPDDFVKMVHALLDFLHLAERAQLSEADVQEMEGALQRFHSLKRVLVGLGLITDLSKFDDIPKFHMLGHYAHSIRELGTPDGYNTESPEYLHIIYAKRGWLVSNRREAIRQIIKYVQRLEAIRIQRAYMDKYYGESPRLKLGSGDAGGDGDDEDVEMSCQNFAGDCLLQADSGRNF